MGTGDTVPRPRLVVVGVDGSAGSAEALRWAAGEVARDGGRLRILHAWHASPFVPASSIYNPVGSRPDPLDEAHRRLDRSVVLAFEGQPPPVPVERRLVLGGAGEVLVAASRSADLLVLGASRESDATRLLVGSVIRYCQRHAACRVMVVGGAPLAHTADAPTADVPPPRHAAAPTPPVGPLRPD